MRIDTDRLLALATLLAAGGTIGACSSSGGSSGGTACKQKGDETCSGDTVMQCNDALQWEAKKDCTLDGRKCVQVTGVDADCEA